MNDPLVSVFLPCFNQEKYVEEAIRSAADQNYENLVVVVGDDGSADNTYEIVERLGREYGDRVHIVKDRQHLGLVGNFQRTLQACKGQFVAFHAGDDVFLPGKIREQVEWFEQDQNRVLCGHDVMVQNELKNTTKYHKCNPKHAKALIKPWLFRCQCSPGSIMVRRSALPPYGFDERFAYANDLKLFVDVLKGGGEWGCVDGVYSIYRKNNLSVTEAKNEACMEDYIELLKLFGVEFNQWYDEIREAIFKNYYTLARARFDHKEIVECRKSTIEAFRYGSLIQRFRIACFFPMLLQKRYNLPKIIRYYVFWMMNRL